VTLSTVLLTAEINEKNMPSLRILIVDDQRPVLDGVRSLLSSRAEWLVCGEASDGVEAVEKAKTLRPDVVLMDISMPRMDGLKATRIIRREVPDSIVVLVSQNDSNLVARQAGEVDACGYVAKSDLSQQLLPTVDRVVAESNGTKTGKAQENKPKLGAADAKKIDPEVARYAQLLDLSFNAIMLRDQHDRITYWNKGAEELYGWTRDEALGQVPHTLFQTTFPEPLPSIFARLRSEKRWQGELTHIRKDGTNLTVLSRWALTHDQETNAEVIMEANIDITQAKDADRANNLLAAIVDSSDDAVISKSLNGIITSWNKAAERMFGHTLEEAVGRHITLIIPPDRRAEETKILEQLKRGERIDHFETIRMRKDGTLLDLSLTISPVKDAAGRVVGASKVARDISERKQAERALRESEERYRTLADQLEKQVHSRTQELEERNAEVLQQSEQLRELSNRLLQTQDDERRHIARELHDSAGQIIAALAMNLASMTQQVSKSPILGKVLDDSQTLVQQLNKEIRTTSYLLHPPLLDDNGLPEAIRWYLHGLMERSGLSVDLDIAEDFGRLPNEMELTIFRIVQECLTNIHRHSGSKIAMVRLSRTAGEVALEIQDQGKGIPPEKLDGIRAQRSGVGITGMRERVRHFHGALQIHSNAKGTKISIALPLPKLEIAQAEDTLHEQPSGNAA
jgi:PAS domain S-box-containing protein